MNPTSDTERSRIQSEAQLIVMQLKSEQLSIIIGWATRHAVPHKPFIYSIFCNEWRFFIVLKNQFNQKSF